MPPTQSAFERCFVANGQAYRRWSGLTGRPLAFEAQAALGKERWQTST